MWSYQKISVWVFYSARVRSAVDAVDGERAGRAPSAAPEPAVVDFDCTTSIVCLV